MTSVKCFVKVKVRKALSQSVVQVRHSALESREERKRLLNLVTLQLPGLTQEH